VEEHPSRVEGIVCPGELGLYHHSQFSVPFPSEKAPVERLFQLHQKWF
jgi:hypothetical protein